MYLLICLKHAAPGKPYRRVRECPSLVKADNISHASQLHGFWKFEIHVVLGHPNIGYAANSHQDSGNAHRCSIHQHIQQPVHHLAASLLESGSFDEVGDVDEQLQKESKGIQAEHVLQQHSSMYLKREGLTAAQHEP